MDKIEKFANEKNQTHVIIFTGLIEHNINEPMYDLYQRGHHEEGDTFAETLGKIEIIACTITELSAAIINFQQLKIVKELPEIRSYMGPNVGRPYTYFTDTSCAETQEMQIKLTWDS